MTTELEDLLNTLLSQLVDDNVVAILLLGSHARGNGGLYSDVDLRRYVRLAPQAEPHSFRFMDGWMVSVYSLTLEEEALGLVEPERAIWTIPGLLQGQVLLDKDGALSDLIVRARGMTWQEMQTKADRFASTELCGFAEEVCKVLDGLINDRQGKVLHAGLGLVEGMAKVVLVQRGVMVPTENEFIDLAQETAGRGSAWTQAYRAALGLSACEAQNDHWRCRGQAFLRLYQETVHLMQPLLQMEDEKVIRHALGLIAQAGYAT